jgi:two-component system, NarL family, response regulator DegU
MMDESASGARRIIVADDHPLFRSALTSLLEGPGLEVVAQASDGEQALELCRRLRPDVVVMDVIMPKMDGIAASRAIKAELPGTIVLMMTASEDLDHLAEALRAGAAGYLLKTASSQKTIETIGKALEGESPLDPGVSRRLVRLLKRSEETQGQLGPASGEGPPERRTRKPLPAGARSLSHREVEVLRLMARGETNQQIASELFLSTSTVKNHVHKVISKLGVSDRTQAVVLALELGLLSNLF